ncbi:SEH-associated protein 4 [Zancudomyces culisetae]|uniref:SEH-associated protein 4 n=1 Tax=Zancudomyces culisetae TaxID=1213189 RepID=A0A1R1PV86_ZANCU|nr:SEH-associated protein 4 [Zancudomyces culisetae]|eukprot:OMH84861.1 SEH-associated protein 4 [Zancudomyces culisetae]
MIQDLAELVDSPLDTDDRFLLYTQNRLKLYKKEQNPDKSVRVEKLDSLKLEEPICCLDWSRRICFGYGILATGTKTGSVDLRLIEQLHDENRMKQQRQYGRNKKIGKGDESGRDSNISKVHKSKESNRRKLCVKQEEHAPLEQKDIFFKHSLNMIQQSGRKTNAVKFNDLDGIKLAAGFNKLTGQSSIVVVDIMQKIEEKQILVGYDDFLSARTERVLKQQYRRRARNNWGSTRHNLSEGITVVKEWEVQQDLGIEYTFTGNGNVGGSEEIQILYEPHSIKSLCWVPQSKHALVAGCKDGAGVIRMYSTNTPGNCESLVFNEDGGKKGAIYGIEFDPFNENRFLAHDKNKTVRIYDIRWPSSSIKLNLDEIIKYGIKQVHYSKSKKDIVEILGLREYKIDIWKIDQEIKDKAAVDRNNIVLDNEYSNSYDKEYDEKRNVTTKGKEIENGIAVDTQISYPADILMRTHLHVKIPSQSQSQKQKQKQKQNSEKKKGKHEFAKENENENKSENEEDGSNEEGIPFINSFFSGISCGKHTQNKIESKYGNETPRQKNTKQHAHSSTLINTENGKCEEKVLVCLNNGELYVLEEPGSYIFDISPSGKIAIAAKGDFNDLQVKNRTSRDMSISILDNITSANVDSGANDGGGSSGVNSRQFVEVLNPVLGMGSEGNSGDISEIMRKRALIGYGVDLEHNATIFKSGSTLFEVWRYLRNANALKREKILLDPQTGKDESFCGIYNMLMCHGKYHDLTDDGLQIIHQDILERSAAVCPFLQNQKIQGVKTGSYQVPVVYEGSKKNIERMLALIMLGYLKERDAVCHITQDIVARKEYEVAAEMCVMYGEYELAIESLAKSNGTKYQMLMCLLSSQFDAEDNRLIPFKRCTPLNTLTVEKLADAFDSNDVILSMLSYLKSGNWGTVLKKSRLSLTKKLVMALRLLDDTSLASLLAELYVECCNKGKIEGLILTGILNHGYLILQKYVDLTGDVQTAALIGMLEPIQYNRTTNSPQLDENSHIVIFEKYYSQYKHLLNKWRLYNQRCILDVKINQLRTTWTNTSGEFYSSQYYNPISFLLNHVNPVQIKCSFCRTGIVYFKKFKIHPILDFKNNPKEAEIFENFFDLFPVIDYQSTKSATPAGRLASVSGKYDQALTHTKNSLSSYQMGTKEFKQINTASALDTITNSSSSAKNTTLDSSSSKATENSKSNGTQPVTRKQSTKAAAKKSLYRDDSLSSASGFDRRQNIAHEFISQHTLPSTPNSIANINKVGNKFSKHSISTATTTTEATPASNTNGVGNSVYSRAIYTHCPKCSNLLPSCSVCRLTLGTSQINNAASSLNHLSDSTGTNKIDFWFSWCQSCGHGGHYSHLSLWFDKNSFCPVPQCNCQCYSL